MNFRSTSTTPRQKLLLIGFGLALFALGLVAVEGVLALFDLGDPQVYEDPFVGFVPGRDLFTRTTKPSGEAVYKTQPHKLAFFNEQEFKAEKPPGSYRVFALGGSTTAGRPYDAAVAFPRWLERYLDAADPSREWEVVNCGADSYASYRIIVLLRELVRYEPDLFLVYTGQNEFLEERTYADILHEHRALRQLRTWLLGLRSVTLAQQLWPAKEKARPSMPAEVTAKLDSWTGLELYHRDDALKASVIAHFEYNLQQIVALARRQGSGVIFVKPASNLKDFSPFKSEHRADLAPADRVRFAELLELGQKQLATAQPALAKNTLTQALALDPDFAQAHFRLGQSLFQLGEFAAAREAFIRAKDQDIAPLRALEPIAELVPQMAQRAGVPWIDLPQILESDSQERWGHRILGKEYFLDHVHPDIATHQLIAERMLEILIQQGVVTQRPGWEARRAAAEAAATAGLDRAYYAQRDLNLAKVLGWAGKLEEAEEPLLRAVEVLPDHPEIHLNLGIIYQRSGRLTAAQKELERAVELAPQMPQNHFNLGVVLGSLGQVEAGIRALLTAIALRPDYPEAYFDLGVLELARERPEPALAAFAKVRAQKGETAEVLVQEGLAYRLQGRTDDATRAFERALALDPSSGAAQLDLGITLARTGRLEEAAKVLTAALAAQPEGLAAAEILYNLGLVYSQQGHKDQALAAYERVLTFAPDHVQALNNQAILLAAQGRLDAAEQALTRALVADPDYAEAHFNLGVVLDARGQPRAAVRAIEQALLREPENGRFHLALGSLKWALGETQEARQHFARAARAGTELPPEIARILASSPR